MVLTPVQILRHFNKSGGPGEITKPPIAFSEKLQGQIRSKLSELKAEDAIIVYWQSFGEWLFVLPDRIIFPVKERHIIIKYDEIEGISPSPNKEVFYHEKEKAFLSIKLHSGSEYIVPVEAGASAFGLWHALSRVQG